MCVINVSNKRKTGKWRKICLFPAGFEPATLCVWGTRDNRYTMETCYVCRLLFGFHITGWLPKKWKKLSSHLGVEPRTFGLEVQRAIHCANGTVSHWDTRNPRLGLLQVYRIHSILEVRHDILFEILKSPICRHSRTSRYDILLPDPEYTLPCS